MSNRLLSLPKAANLHAMWFAMCVAVRQASNSYLAVWIWSLLYTMLMLPWLLNHPINDFKSNFEGMPKHKAQ